MSHTVEPSVFLIAKTEIDTWEIERWLAHIGVNHEVVPRFSHHTKTSSQILTELAGRRCYMSFEPGLNPNVTRIREDIAEYLTNILEKRDGSIFEHYSFTFAIEGVSRVFTGEYNRHRAGTAISEGSMRYIRYENIPYWVPTSYQLDETPLMDDPALLLPISAANDIYDNPSKTKEEACRRSMQRVFYYVQQEYAYQAAVWGEELAPTSSFHKKKQITSAMRRIIPMGVATGGVWTGNIRALRHICEMRVSEFAEEEIVLVVSSMLKILQEVEPIIFGDFAWDKKGFAKPKYSKV